jgi:hypothetical protein
MNRLVPILFFILGSALCTAQTLIPYLGKNGLTGFADMDGKVMITPQFTAIRDFFPPNVPAVTAKKDGQEVWVLRNGLSLPYTNSVAKLYAENQQSLDISTPVDTLKDIAIVCYDNKQVIVHLRTGKKTETFYNPKNSVISWFQLVEPAHPMYSGYSRQYFDGLMMVGDSNGMVNFLDTSLNLVFENYYPGMAAIGQNAFIVANSEQNSQLQTAMGVFLRLLSSGSSFHQVGRAITSLTHRCQALRTT